MADDDDKAITPASLKTYGATLLSGSASTRERISDSKRHDDAAPSMIAARIVDYLRLSNRRFFPRSATEAIVNARPVTKHWRARSYKEG